MKTCDLISGVMPDVMVSVLASNEVDHVFKPILGQNKGYQIGICCFSINQEELKHYKEDE
jgi:hypothetical protein